jgi:ketosteroid isomerase-like protein
MPGSVRDSDERLIREGYDAFNERDIERAIRTMTDDASWANGVEGGNVRGHAAVREDWTRQFKTMQARSRASHLTSGIVSAR